VNSRSRCPLVGWVFTPRLPVRGAKSARTAKKLAVALPGGALPTIGTTLTPIKAAKPAVKTPAKSAKTAKVPAKVAKRPARAVVEPATKKLPVQKTTSLKHAKAPPKKSVTKKAVAPSEPVVAIEPAVALRRGRHPVNPETEFKLFRTTFKIGARIEGEVTAFASHGAVITVTMRGDKHVECYAPTTSLGSPPPARARDVLKRGDRRAFRLLTVDVDRRIAELALA